MLSNMDDSGLPHVCDYSSNICWLVAWAQVRQALHQHTQYYTVLKSFYTMLLDGVTRILYLSKHNIVVMIILDMFYGEAKGVCLNFQGPRHSYSNPYCWISLKNRNPRYVIHSCKAT